eukprot:ANDGO_05331.mRNA.1 hypothetical protein
MEQNVFFPTTWDAPDHDQSSFFPVSHGADVPAASENPCDSLLSTDGSFSPKDPVQVRGGEGGGQGESVSAMAQNIARIMAELEETSVEHREVLLQCLKEHELRLRASLKSRELVFSSAEHGFPRFELLAEQEFKMRQMIDDVNQAWGMTSALHLGKQ